MDPDYTLTVISYLQIWLFHEDFQNLAHWKGTPQKDSFLTHLKSTSSQTNVETSHESYAVLQQCGFRQWPPWRLSSPSPGTFSPGVRLGTQWGSKTDDPRKTERTSGILFRLQSKAPTKLRPRSDTRRVLLYILSSKWINGEGDNVPILLGFFKNPFSFFVFPVNPWIHFDY